MRPFNNKKFLLYFLSVFTLAVAAPAKAATLSFFCITNNSAGNCAIGESQLSVNVSTYGTNQARFDFLNVGADASSITDVYFDDGALLGIATIVNGPGVSFSQGASPPNLPGGNNVTPPFQVTEGFLADSDPSVTVNGVNPGETLGIIFDLQTGKTFSDVLADLADGSLRIGMRAQAFAGGGGESFVNYPVPIPAAVWLFGSGLLGLVGSARRNRKNG